jgi:hypothetical protein
MCHAARVTEQEWRVDRRTTILKVIAALVFVALAIVIASDLAGKLLGLAIAAALAAFAARDLLAPVRLSADTHGVTVISGFAGHRHIPWSDVERVRVDVQRRFGRRSELLEIDAGERLHLFSAAELGTDCDEVAAALVTLRTGR